MKFIILLLGLILWAPAGMAETTGTVELKIELPKPLFVGTPKNIVSSNLEAPTGKSREPLMVPQGVALVSKDKLVTASDSEPIIGEPAMLTDGDKEGGDGSYVEFGPGKQWVQIDLEARHEIHALTIWHFHSQARAYKDVIVQVADDEDFLENTQIVYNNDHDNSAGLGIGKDKEWIETYEGRLIRLERPLTAQYVRLWSNGSTASEMNHYIEVEVYGRPASK